jgi:hypothetical protein
MEDGGGRKVGLWYCISISHSDVKSDLLGPTRQLNADEPLMMNAHPKMVALGDWAVGGDKVMGSWGRRVEPCEWDPCPDL